MLSHVIKSTPMRYAFAGAAFGSVFSACALAYDAVLINPGAGSLIDLARDNPVHLAMALVPLILGFTFYKVGQSRAELVEELQRREAAERTLIYNAFHDSLTSLENRHALERTVEEIVAAGIGNGNRPVLMLLDLDKFKFINDTMGHNVGDAILLALSRRLREAAGKQQRLYRLGGDEFVILWLGAPPEAVVRQFCDALVRLISFPFEVDGVRLAAGGSVGVTWLEEPDTTMSDALRRADLALYRAKEMPGSQFVVYDRAIAYEAEQRMQMEKDLRLALEEKQFFLQYQPIVNLETNRIHALEALVRWRLKDEIIRPDMFIPVAEKSGLIIPLGKWILAQACRDAAGWPETVGISINVAGEQFKDSSFVPFISETLRTTGLAPRRLTIEVTESLFTVDVGVVRTSLMRLRAMGLRIALDDFGTGFSSINHLRTFPLDTLKIDRSFTQSMLGDQREAELINVILKLSKAFDMTTTVEGVETEGQLEFIRRAGAGSVQGFLFSRPIDADGVCALLSGGIEDPAEQIGAVVHQLRA